MDGVPSRLVLLLRCSVRHPADAVHLPRGQGVAGSNPVSPTNKTAGQGLFPTREAAHRLNGLVGLPIKRISITNLDLIVRTPGGLARKGQRRH